MKKKRLLTGILAGAMAFVISFGVVPAQKAEAAKGALLVYSETADYTEWELNGPIANKGWYIDPKTGGERYSVSMRDAWYQVNGYPMHPILNITTEPRDPSEYGVYQFADGVIYQLNNAVSFGGKAGISEDRVLSFVQNGYFSINRWTNEPTTFTEKDRAIRMILSNGYCSEYIQQFKDMGYLDPNYVLPEGYVERSATTTSDYWMSMVGACPGYTGPMPY